MMFRVRQNPSRYQKNNGNLFMLTITSKIAIPLSEINISYITAQGSGGQNVNKVASAAHLRFSIEDSSLPDDFKQRLRQLSDHRITADGVIIIKAQSHRTREQNRQSALNRLQEVIQSVASVPKKRKPTRPSAGAKRKRLDSKNKRGQTKIMRSKVEE